jgi:DNA-binding beta-propeller fold protein YncE
MGTYAEAGLRVKIGGRVHAVQRPFGTIAASEGRVTDVAVDHGGRVHVLVRRDPLTEPPGPAVLVFDAQGHRLGAWGTEIADAHMIACDGEGRLWITDRDAHEVIAFTPQGERVASIGTRHGPGQPFGHPSDIAFGPAGHVYVADGYGHAFVHRFAADLEPQVRWGGIGTGPGHFVTAHGIWVCADGRVVVADRENDRLQVFDRDGNVLGAIDGFHRPSDIWGDAVGRLFVTDGVPSLTCLSPDLGRIDRCRPVLNGAHGLWGTADGVLYLAEGNPSRITRLVPVG